MVNEESPKEACLKFLRKLKERGKLLPGFDESLTILRDEAARHGLSDSDVDLLVKTITKVDLGGTKLTGLIKCLIPERRMPDKAVKKMITWLLSSLNDMTISVASITFQWIIGLLQNGLTDMKIINIYYDPFFFVLTTQEKLVAYAAELVYILTKPEDVTRRQVARLLKLQQGRTQNKPVTALLSLFKSYKPEQVPEKIPSVNVKSAWKQIPESLRLGLYEASQRALAREIREDWKQDLRWNVAEDSRKKMKKKRQQQQSLLPPVGYIQIGSRIFKNKDGKSIFEVRTLEDLGKHQLSVELPCNATSLLVNVAGYHLLTFADSDYQSRFSFNIYNTLQSAFLFEEDKCSYDEKEKLLGMLVEFSEYMQQGVLVVNRFLDEYLSLNSRKHRDKCFKLLEWHTFTSFTELHDRVLVHIEIVYYSSSLSEKCRIIRTLRTMIANIFIDQETDSGQAALFLGRNPMGELVKIIPPLNMFVKDLIVGGINMHSFSSILLSEALTFYEQVSVLEERSNKPLWTLAPPTVIYGGLLSKSVAILSRVCALLLRYRQMSARLRELECRHLFGTEISILNVYAKDLANTLHFNEAFKSRAEGHFLRRLPDSVINDLSDVPLDLLLNINNHYATLPHKSTLVETGLSLKDAAGVALNWYPDVSDFLMVFNQ